MEGSLFAFRNIKAIDRASAERGRLSWCVVSTSPHILCSIPILRFDFTNSRGHTPTKSHSWSTVVSGSRFQQREIRDRAPRASSGFGSHLR